MLVTGRTTLTKNMGCEGHRKYYFFSNATLLGVSARDDTDHITGQQRWFARSHVSLERPGVRFTVSTKHGMLMWTWWRPRVLVPDHLTSCDGKPWDTSGVKITRGRSFGCDGRDGISHESEPVLVGIGRWWWVEPCRLLHKLGVATSEG